MDIAEYGLIEHDIRFLKERLDNSELITVHGNRTTTGEITSYTPATGFTFYHIKSYITLIGNEDTNGVNAQITVSVQNDSSTKDILGGTGLNNANSSFWNNSNADASRVISDIPSKLVGNSTKKFMLNLDATSSASITVYGTIIGYIEAS